MRKNIAIGVVSLMLLMPAAGNAAGLYRDAGARVAFPGEVYLGIKLGTYSVEQNVSGSIPFEADSMGFTFGGDINDYLALEFAYTHTVSADKTDDGSGSIARFSVNTLGFFLVAKSEGDLYVRGRVGYTRAGQKLDYLGQNPSDNVYGVAYGIGAGYKLSRDAAIEIEYTVFPETDDFFGVPIVGEMESDLVTVGFTWSYE